MMSVVANATFGMEAKTLAMRCCATADYPPNFQPDQAALSHFWGHKYIAITVDSDTARNKLDPTASTAAGLAPLSCISPAHAGAGTKSRTSAAGPPHLR